MANIFMQMITPNSGISHKRALATVAGFTLIFIALADVFTTVTVDAVVLETLQWITIAGMGAATAEQFAPGKKGAQSRMETKTTVVETSPVEEVAPKT